MRTVICGLVLLLGGLVLVVLSLFDREGAQILCAALMMAAAMVGAGLLMDQTNRRMVSREVGRNRTAPAAKRALELRT